MFYGLKYCNLVFKEFLEVGTPLDLAEGTSGIFWNMSDKELNFNAPFNHNMEKNRLNRTVNL